MTNLKETLWKPYQIAAVQKDSTTKLDKAQVDKVYEGLNKFLGENFEVHIPWPCEEGRQLEQNSQLLQAMDIAKKIDYPENNLGKPLVWYKKIWKLKSTDN